MLRTPPASKDGDEAASTGVPVFRFPEWFITQDTQSQGSNRQEREREGEVRSRLLIHANALSKGKFRHPDTDRRLSVVPVRFVRACRKGHIGDIDWYFFLHGADDTCRKQCRQLYMDERGTSGDLTDIFVRCDCGRSRSMARVAREKADIFGKCDGARPWLGPRMQEKCEETNRLLVRTASNTWFPQRLAVISLPERNQVVQEAVSAVWDFLETAESEPMLPRNAARQR